MAINLKLPELAVREQRLGAIISYDGSAQDIYEKSLHRSLKPQERRFSQCAGCSSSCAFGIMANIIGAVIINHAPIGCASDFAQAQDNVRRGAALRGINIENFKAISTNLQEKDTIYGGDAKLREAVLLAKERFNPKIIFVSASCASGIIGEDIESLAEELGEETGIKIVPVYCEGFKSKVWTTGFDVAGHAILRNLVKKSSKKTNHVNIINFQGAHVFDDLLGKLDLIPRYLFPFSTFEEIEKTSDAIATANICETLGSYVSAALESEFDVPEVRAPIPTGLKWTDEWLREIGRLVNKEERAEEIIKEEHERIRPRLEELREKLKGKKIYIMAGDSIVQSYVSVADSLGLEVIGALGFHHDQVYDNDYQEINTVGNMLKHIGDVGNYCVTNKQPYQFTNILKKLNPDFVLARHPAIAVIVNKLGFPAFHLADPNMIIGYDGIIDLGERVYECIRTKKHIDTLAKHFESPYTDWWLEQDPFTFERGGKELE
ncbi:nitrogenase component 1 [Clostridium sp. WILCCON 0269]|uniref:Nitrogenase component 1 n=1 Tax=Candidatus Clostridium eludens TaxID=3381663 RepID=A0ABW8SE96_9CLOT